MTRFQPPPGTGRSGGNPTEEWRWLWCRTCKRITRHEKTYGRVPECQEHDPPKAQPTLFPKQPG